LAAEIARTSLASSARSTLDLGLATEIMDIDPTRRRAAARGTRQVYSHSLQRRSNSVACHGNRM
jgi:hypothetical protein